MIARLFAVLVGMVIAGCSTQTVNQIGNERYEVLNVGAENTYTLGGEIIRGRQALVAEFDKLKDAKPPISIWLTATNGATDVKEVEDAAIQAGLSVGEVDVMEAPSEH